jgi:uncharacterized repeat protein (TIGR02543 family)
VDITLEARWSIICYKVHFADSDVPDTCVNYNTTAARPEDPERKCYEFVGWVREDGTQWSFTNFITDSITLVAEWEPIDGCTPGGETSVSANALSAVLVYPNPASEYVIVSGLEGGEAINLIDTKGALLLSHKATGSEETIEVATLPSGIYYVQITKGKAQKTLKLTVR